MKVYCHERPQVPFFWELFWNHNSSHFHVTKQSPYHSCFQNYNASYSHDNKPLTRDHSSFHTICFLFLEWSFFFLKIKLLLLLPLLLSHHLCWPQRHFSYPAHSSNTAPWSTWVTTAIADFDFTVFHVSQRPKEKTSLNTSSLTGNLHIFWGYSISIL